MKNEYDSIIQEAVKSHPSLDWRLINAQMQCESNGDPNAISHCGAIGLLQIMPATAGDLGVSPNDLYDP